MTHPFQSAVDILPADVWLKIFGLVAQHLPWSTFDGRSSTPRASLVSISLTCQAFRFFAQPLLFRRFVFHPFATDASSTTGWKRSEWFPLPPDRIDREIQRLDFYSSNPFATYVRRINMRPWPKAYLPWATVPTLSGDAPDRDLDFLLRKFYEALPRFMNAQIFECMESEFNEFALQQISRLPNLRVLDVYGCNLLPSASTTLSLHTFRFTHWAQRTELTALGVNRWLSLLNPDSLENISIQPSDASSSFFQDIGRMTPFSSLSMLFMHVKSAIFSKKPQSDILLLLDKVPALQYLRICLRDGVNGEDKRMVEGLESPLSSPAPNLEGYWGPYEFLPVILGRSTRGPPLRQLHLDTLGLGGNPFAFCLQILSWPEFSPRLRGVTHFRLIISSIEYDDLTKLCLLLPELQELSLEGKWSQERQVTKETFLDDMLGIQLPKQIRSFSIDWTASTSLDVNSKHRQVQAQLANRYPSLEKLWLCDWIKSALLWRRDPSGEERLTIYQIESRKGNRVASDAHFKYFHFKFGPGL